LNQSTFTAAPVDTAAAVSGRIESATGTFGSVRAYPMFRRLWAGAIASSIGQWMQSTALAWLALDLTDRSSFVGLVAFAAGLPFLAVSVPAGFLVDRFDRRWVLMTCQLLAASLAILLAIDVLAGFVKPWHLLIFAFLNGSLQATTNPAQQSIVPSLVPRRSLTNAIGLMGAGMNGTRVIGPTIAGTVIGLAGTGFAFLMQAAALLAALGLLLTVRFPDTSGPRAVTSLSSLLDGARTVAGHPDLRVLLILVSIPTFFLFPYLSFLSVFARDILDIGPEGMGALMAASGVGAVAGSLYIASRKSSLGSRFLVLQTATYGAVIMTFALSERVLLSLCCLVAAGFLGASFVSAVNASLQHRINDDVRGRVLGIYMLTWGLMPLGALPMGLLSKRIGIQSALALAAGMSIFLTGMLAVVSDSLRSD
jgi:MFS family permease